MTVGARTPSPAPRPRRARGLSPGVRARRALAVDVLVGAIIAAIALSIAAGLGVIAFFAVPILLLGLVWIGAERLVGALLRGRRRGRRRAA
jgi:hypothetical protein